MKLACASSALAREIAAGELTQLEFVALCARAFACDGIVFDTAHFPRTDDDYLAQLKKMAVDWGLSVAALRDERFFASAPERMTEILGYAVALGAPLVAAPLARETECSWSEQLERLGAAASIAKRLNVTLALRNAPESFAAGSHDCKRVLKEADSAWLRCGLQPRRLDAGSDARDLAQDTVLLWSDLRAEGRDAIARTVAEFSEYGGFVALDDEAGGAGPAEVRAAVALWREQLCRARELNHR